MYHFVCVCRCITHPVFISLWYSLCACLYRKVSILQGHQLVDLGSNVLSDFVCATNTATLFPDKFKFSSQSFEHRNAGDRKFNPKRNIVNNTAKNVLAHALENGCVHVLKYMFLIIIYIISICVINVCIKVCLYVCVYISALANAVKWFLKWL